MKSEQRNKIYIGLFIILLMVSSTAGFIVSFGEDGSTVEKEGKKFRNTGNFWLLEENNREYYFYYLPDQVGDYNSISLGNSVKLYSEELSEVQLNRLSYIFASNNVKFQILEERDCNSEGQTLVIESGSDKIYKENSCLFLEGDIEKSIDKIGYSLLL